MNTKTWFSLSVLVVIGIIVVIVMQSVRTPSSAPSAGVTPATPDQVVCTMEAKMCPDGSFVGRSGPKCEFAACPSAKPTSSTSTAKPTTSAGTSQTTTPSAGPSFAPYKSGVNGMISLDHKAYSTQVAVYRVSDKTRPYAFMQADQNGLYSFALPPGSYILGAIDTKVQCESPEVTVGTLSYITANIACK